MSNRSLKFGLFVVVCASMTSVADAGGRFGYYNGPSTYYAPAPVSYVYQPVVVPQVVYRSVPVVHAPVITHYAPPVIPSYTRTTRYDPYGRFARITRKTYSPYGTLETKYRFDKKYGIWRVKQDFDD